jgi:hypothetical protein
LSRSELLRLLGAAGAVAALGVPLSADETEPVDAAPTDALQRCALSRLEDFTGWLAEFGGRGYVGEMQWANDLERGFDDAADWNALGRKWYEWAKAADLWAAMWAVVERNDFWLTPYVSSPEDGSLAVDTPQSQASVFEAQPQTYVKGMNISGAEIIDDASFSNAAPGPYGPGDPEAAPGARWWFASLATLDYLARRGTTTVRLPFRWERLQPTPGGGLQQSALAQLKAAVGRAGAAGLGVVLDVHNYGGYRVSTSRGPVKLKLGSPELPAEHLADLWGRLAYAFKDDATVVAYDLMNEPYNDPDTQDGQPGVHRGDHATSARAWESYAQAALTRIRQTRDTKPVMVPLYCDVGHAQKTHPGGGWISDPADNHRYTAHQYFDTFRGPNTGGGSYAFSYDDEVRYLSG